MKCIVITIGYTEKKIHVTQKCVDLKKMSKNNCL